MPLWIRNTPEYIRDEGSIEIRLWSSTEQQKTIKPEAKTETTKPAEPTQINELEKFSIENELKQIENEWKTKFSIKEEEKTEVLESKPKSETKKEKTSEEEQIEINKFKNYSDLLNQQFLSSIEIHKKPTEFTLLKQIFNFKLINANEEISVAAGDESNLFEIDESSFKKLLFIEYKIQRVNDLLSKRSKSFLNEMNKEDLKRLNEERERDEYLRACDKYVANQGAFFGNLTGDSDLSSFKLNEIKIDAGDNGEAEMQAKLDSFKTQIDEEVSKKVVHPVNETDAKRPMPDFKKLKEESLKNQLKVKEFFTGSVTSKGKQVEEEIEIEEEEASKGYNQSLIIKIKETNEEIVRVLPTVDSKSQNEIRRNIFYDKLIR